MRDIGLMQNDEPARAPVHAGHGDRRRRQDVEVQGQRGGRGHAGGQVRRRHRAACSCCSPRRRRRTWTGAPRAPRASTASWAASTASSRATPTARARRASPAQADRKVLRKLHQTIRKITDDFESRWHFNTSIAAIMELVNELYAEEANLSGAAHGRGAGEAGAAAGAVRAVPVAGDLGGDRPRPGPVFRQPWPCFDPELAKEDEAEIVVQVNGKLRSRISAPFGTSKEELERNALADEKREGAHGRQADRRASSWCRTSW